MEEKGDYLKNFAMVIPSTAIYQFKGYQIFRATAKEFDEFKKWFEGQKYQQVQLNGSDLDMWVRRTDLVHDHIGYSLQNLFDNWKANPPKTGYGFTSFEIKM